MPTTGPDAAVTIPAITIQIPPQRIPAPTVSDTLDAAARNPDQAAEEEAKEAAKDRNDFIKRLFAVAISVGFATTATKTLLWLVTFSTTTPGGYRSSALLLTSLVLVVESWEGYLASLRNYALIDRARFFIDIILVFEYLLLMHLSVPPTENNSPPESVAHYNFLVCICTIFFTYLLWDYFRIRAYSCNYRIGTRYKVKGAFSALFPFVAGLFAGESTYKGPSITLYWFIYFVIIYVLPDFTPEKRFYTMIFAIVYGMLMYRRDKAKRFSIGRKLLWASVPIVLLLAVRFTCRVWEVVC